MFTFKLKDVANFMLVLMMVRGITDEGHTDNKESLKGDEIVFFFFFFYTFIHHYIHYYIMKDAYERGLKQHKNMEFMI